MNTIMRSHDDWFDSWFFGPAFAILQYRDLDFGICDSKRREEAKSSESIPRVYLDYVEYLKVILVDQHV